MIFYFCQVPCSAPRTSESWLSVTTRWKSWTSRPFMDFIRYIKQRSKVWTGTVDPLYFKVCWHYATIFTFITFYIHSYHTIIHSFILHHLPRPVFLLAWVGVEQIFFPLLLLWDLHKRFSFVTFTYVCLKWWPMNHSNILSGIQIELNPMLGSGPRTSVFQPRVRN